MTATNSLGWEVQGYTEEHGWRAINPKAVPQLREEAEAELLQLGLLGCSLFRVYEVLDHPTTRRNQ